MVTIKSPKKNYGINFPSSVNEITTDMLDAITENVKLPKHYCIVALCYKTKVFDFCTMINTNKNVEIGVVPILAKISKEDSEETAACVGDKLVIDRSSLERGSHLKINTMISSDNARKYFQSDENLHKAIISKNDTVVIGKDMNKQLLASNSPEIIIMEFKIVPVNDIAASVPFGNNIIDPFVYREVTNKA